MVSSPLSNYLHAHRKRLALTQDEMAFLLGMQDGTSVCRSERFARVPSLEDALAYEVIHQKPARELFAGLYEQVVHDLAARALILSQRTADEPGRHAACKRKLLADLATRPADPNQPS